MQSFDNNTQAFLALVRAGLWETEVRLLPFGNIDFREVFRLSQEQSVAGLVAAGLEHVVDVKVPKEVVLAFVGETLQIEQRNTAMNKFIGGTLEKLMDNGISAVLVKGQGVAQCYERPLWRKSGDVDLLLDKENYHKAVDYLLPLSEGNNPEGHYSKHRGLIFSPWYLELHGTFRSGLSLRVDKAIDKVQNNTVGNGNFRTWMNNKIAVTLPGVDDDVFFIFAHCIQHFYRETLALKQLCDWCRLLWVYRDSVDVSLLKERVLELGMVKEWDCFASAAVEYLGMPQQAMPLFDSTLNSKRAADIMHFLICGRYRNKILKTFEIFKLFPANTTKFLPGILFNVNLLKIKERLFANGVD